MQHPNRTGPGLHWRKCLSILGITLLVLVGVTVFSQLWIRWGPLPDIRVKGRVVDRDTGLGVPGADVILAMTASARMWHGSHSGCAGGGAVIRTDAAGNFDYSITAREALGPRNPTGGWGITIFVYHPAYEAALRHDLLPHQLSEIAKLSAEGPPLPVSGLYKTYPVYADKKPGPFVIDVTARRDSELDQLVYFGTALQNNCLDTRTDRGQSEFLQKLYLRMWSLRCAEPKASDVRTYFELQDIHSLFESVLRVVADQTGALGSQTIRNQHNSDRSEYLWRHLLAWYPSYESAEGFGRGPNQEELEKFCSLYAPPIKTVLNKDFRSWINASRF